MRCMFNSSGWPCGLSAQVDYPEAPVFYFSWPESVSSLKCLWGAGSEGARMGAATLWSAFEGLGVCLCARGHLACFGAAVTTFLYCHILVPHPGKVRRLRFQTLQLFLEEAGCGAWFLSRRSTHY